MPKILYLGTDPSHCSLEGEIVHYPVIEVVPVGWDDVCVRAARDQFEYFTHVIFTSKNGVRFFLSLFKGCSLEGKRIISVGPVTTEALGREGVITAERTCQEGVIEVLKGEDLLEAYVLMPTSKRARPLLKEFLQERGVSFHLCPLYEPIPSLREPIPSLNAFDVVVFTSPSTVAAFMSSFPTLPIHVRCMAQGELTKRAIQKLYKKRADPILILNSYSGGKL